MPFYTLLNQVFPMDHTQRRDEEPLHLTYTSHSKLPLYTHQLPVMKTDICKVNNHNICMCTQHSLEEHIPHPQRVVYLASSIVKHTQ